MCTLFQQLDLILLDHGCHVCVSSCGLTLFHGKIEGRDAARRSSDYAVQDKRRKPLSATHGKCAPRDENIAKEVDHTDIRNLCGTSNFVQQYVSRLQDRESVHYKVDKGSAAAITTYTIWIIHNGSSIMDANKASGSVQTHRVHIGRESRTVFRGDYRAMKTRG
jgi:hypothetical protein